MGKGKAKKAKSSPRPEPSNSFPPQPTCTCGHDHEPPRASDGHNVEGWTNEDIRIYNELLTERAKLEKEKNELEQKSARHQAERALLNEDAAALDSLFKVQLTGEYKFTGSSPCCLDFSSDPVISRNKCHHEICSRAKSLGISWMELDTIKYYQTRITSERTLRMKNALRKQRDVELERVKKDDDDEIATRNRRSAMLEKTSAKGSEVSDKQSSNKSGTSQTVASKKSTAQNSKNNSMLDAVQANEAVIRGIHVKMDKIRRDFQAGKFDAARAKSKLDETSQEMTQATKQSDTFKDMILNTTSSQDFQYAHSNLSRALSSSLSSSSKDAFSQALNVMKGFFSASDQRDVQAAISDLRSVIDMNNPASSTQYKGLRSLDDLRALPNAKGFSISLTNCASVRKVCTNVVELFLHLRRAEDHAVLRAAAREVKLDKSLVNANEAAIEMERNAAILAVHKLASSSATDAAPKHIFESMKAIRDKAVNESPLPPLTEYELKRSFEETLANQLGNSLWAKATSANNSSGGVNERELQGMLISAIIVYSERLPEKYARYIDLVARHFDTRRPSNPKLGQTLDRVLDHVKSQVSGFLDKVRRDQDNRKPSEEPPNSPAPSPTPSLNTVGSLWDMQGQSPGGMPTLQQMFETIIDSNTTMSTAAKRQLGSDLEAFNTQPSARSDMKLISRIQEHMTKLGTEYLAHVTGTCHSSNNSASPTMKNSKISKSSKKDSPPTAKTSKFHENLSTQTSSPPALAAMPSPADNFHAMMDKSLSDFRAGLKDHVDIPEELMDPGEISTSSPPPYIANEGRTRSAVKVKHVAVNTPQISKSTSSVSETTNGHSHSGGKESQASASANKILTNRETAIQRQLISMRHNLDLLKITAEPPKILSSDGLGLKDPFMGIVGKIEEQYLGHVAMAREIANVNEWKSLGDWLAKRGS